MVAVSGGMPPKPPRVEGGEIDRNVLPHTGSGGSSVSPVMSRDRCAKQGRGLFCC